MKIVKIIATIIAIIGAINWLLVGVFTFNLVTWIFGVGIFARIIYAIVGIAGCYLIYDLIWNSMNSNRSERKTSSAV